jgi:hypothetical protein
VRVGRIQEQCERDVGQGNDPENGVDESFGPWWGRWRTEEGFDEEV